MKMSKKKTCSGCKADNLTCLLGYNRNDRDGIPSEPCPKPLTNSDLAYAMAYLKAGTAGD